MFDDQKTFLLLADFSLEKSKNTLSNSILLYEMSGQPFSLVELLTPLSSTG